MGLLLTMRKWTGHSICAEFFASSSFHKEKILLWDWDEHAEHCRCCRRCYSTQLYVWPLGSSWCRIWPRKCRSEIVPRGKCITKQGSQRQTGALVWCRNCCIISCWWGCARTTVRISDVLEVGDVDYVEEQFKFGLPCCSRSSPGKSQKTRVPVSPVVAKKKTFFLLKVGLLAVLQLKLLFKRVLRSRVRKEVVVIAIMPQFSRGDINNNLIVYMYKLLAFGI